MTDNNWTCHEREKYVYFTKLQSWETLAKIKNNRCRESHPWRKYKHHSDNSWICHGAGTSDIVTCHGAGPSVIVTISGYVMAQVQVT